MSLRMLDFTILKVLDEEYADNLNILKEKVQKVYDNRYPMLYFNFNDFRRCVEQLIEEGLITVTTESETPQLTEKGLEELKKRTLPSLNEQLEKLKEEKNRRKVEELKKQLQRKTRMLRELRKREKRRIEKELKKKGLKQQDFEQIKEELSKKTLKEILDARR